MTAKFTPPFSPDRVPLSTLLPLRTPLTLYIDPTNVCNFRCKFCFNGDETAIAKMEKALLPFDKFESIVEQLKLFPDKIKKVHLHGFGEPLLNKALPAMIRLLKDTVAEKVAITTNGSALTQKNTSKILQSGIDQIHISIYGLNRDDYLNFTQLSVDFEQMIDNIRFFYENRGSCQVHAKLVGTYFSEEAQQRFIDLFGAISDTIYIDNASNIWPDIDISSTLSEGKGELQAQYSTDNSGNKVCPQLFYQMMIHANGRVSPCCADYAAEAQIGHVEEQSLYEIWNGRYLADMRSAHINGAYNKYKGCASCSYPKFGSSVSIGLDRKQLNDMYPASIGA